jgi:hypothetical protein
MNVLETDNLIGKIRQALSQFETQPYGDLRMNADRAAVISVATLRNEVRNVKIVEDIKRSKFVLNLKNSIDENPIPTILAVAAVLAGAAKVIDAVGRAKGSAAYARQVNYRINKNK